MASAISCRTRSRFIGSLSRCSGAVRRQSSARPLTEFTDDEIMLKESVARFSKEQVQPYVTEMDKNSEMRPEIISGLFEQGLMGIEIPSEFGGPAMPFFSVVLAIEELAKVDPSVSVLCDVQNTLFNTAFLQWATPEQRKQYLPRMVKDTVGAFCLSEAGCGSDAFALQTRAVADGDDYILSGEKMWITNAGYAGAFLVFANANPEKRHRGITCFIVDRDMPGVSVGPPEDKLGIRASSTCAVRLDGVRVPKTAIMGELGKGYKYAMEILNEGRIGIAAQMLGLAEGAVESTVPYLQDRKAFGQRLLDFQAIQHQIAEVTTRIEAARVMIYNAVRLKENGSSFVKEAAMAKYFATDVAAQASARSVEWLGGVGYTKAFPAEKFYRDCKIGAIYEGTNNIQLNTIAKFIEQ
ncbi:short/branched chain specific acyl-CoA dehydrogenase, mitochondrial-like [Sycon ciliatum]|uniref:short/branched chain specific acyl-CoA dehydrogenase, mitochondrial-like n=1 Tax=Sycon ciliatum TaxID=27933 RepID=UPI0020A8724F|eukprot:scpid76786/ scgid29211/ Short/branched chain specific acyl-CoA dehydrogenase, mitochondrial; 2-methyl branched chain acyl-CoA dehydrogenase; 2-methylbutyryl-coenzyme A dehydrogenase